MRAKQEKGFSNKKFVVLLISLTIVVLVDISLVKVNDLIDKNFIPLQIKLIIFSICCSLCLLLQIGIIRYVQRLIRTERLFRSLSGRSLRFISLGSVAILAVLLGYIIFEQISFNYYNTLLNILIVAISYGIGAVFVTWLALLFLRWYKSNHSLIILLYFISMLVIAFNLCATGAWASAKLSPPHKIGEYIGSSGDLTPGMFLTLDIIYRVSSFMSFFSIWITTAILMVNYREKLMNVIIDWILLSIPLIYFVVTYFYQFVIGNILTSYIPDDPVTVSIVLGAFLSLSKPIGGLLFGVAFWNIATSVSYEKRIRAYMIISGWGIFLIFAVNQAATQVVAPYPPFGLATITVLNLAGFLMLIGISNSAALVSANTNLRRSIHKHALESRLLNLIGHAEFEKEIQRTVGKIMEDKPDIESAADTEYELDEEELKRYLEVVIKEVKKGETSPDS